MILSTEQVNHPQHYQTDKGIEAIDVLEAFFDKDPMLWTACKYLLRAGKKGDKVEDLRKAQWYLNREISRLETDS